MLEEDLLTLLTLRNTMISRSEWAAHAIDAELREDGRLLNATTLLPHCERLVREGAVLEHQISAKQFAYSVPAQQAFLTLAHALKSKRLNDLAAGLQTRWGRRFDRDPGYLGSVVRIAWLGGDDNAAKDAIDARRSLCYGVHAREDFVAWLSHTLGPDPRPAWLSAISPRDAALVLDHHFDRAMGYLVPAPHALLDAARDPNVQRARHGALKGEEPLAELEPKEAAPLQMLAAFCRGEYEVAADVGERIVEALGKRKHRVLRGAEGVIHMLVCLSVATERASAWDHLRSASKGASAAKAGHLEAYAALDLVARRMRGDESRVLAQDLDHLSCYRTEDFRRAPWYVLLVFAIAHAVCDQPNTAILVLAKQWVMRAQAGGYSRIAHEFQGAIDRLSEQPVAADTIVSCLKQKEPWEFGLDSLALIAQQPPDEVAAPKEKFAAYLTWTLALSTHSQMVDFTPRVVTSARSTKGKEVSFNQLAAGAQPTTAADRQLVGLAKKVRVYGRQERWVVPSEALVALIDHPHVFRTSGAQVHVVRGHARLSVDSQEPSKESPHNSLRVTIVPERLLRAAFAFEEESDGRLVVYERSADLDRIVGALAGKPLLVPETESKRLSHVLAGLSARVSISAHANVEVAGDEVPPDSRPMVRLGWDGTQLSVVLGAAPLGLSGPHVRIGEGSRMLVASVDGRPVRTTRSLSDERACLDALLVDCPSLALVNEDPSASNYSLEDALELLMELEDAGDRVLVAWPKGKRLTPAKRVGLANMKVSVGDASRWLSLDVIVEVDELTTLSFAELLASRGRRFIAVNKGQFVRISDELQKRIGAFEGIVKIKKSGVTASPATLPAIAELGAGAGSFALDAVSAERQAAFRRALALRPRVPRVFRAELRDYQLDGFRWLAQLAEAGFGACLADDMGLGKTIQTLALLCLRRKNGPALVVAPSSVASNWLAEAQRFAPSLRVTLLADAADRALALDALGPSDVLVCSYGLLQREGESLSAVAFDSVVFDEAHMLKNAGTKRSKASKSLQGHFRLSLSGTPIENHLGELWSLMESTVPGLLGTKKHFESHFANPIAGGDRARARELRALIRPFMLRRTKSQVLDELPPRTEVTVRVTPNPQERAFYEAIRRRAVSQLEGNGPSELPNRITILAEITKLRQAAVDPRLIDEGGPTGSKIEALMERVSALRAEGHRVLVFSQFLGALALVRAALDEANIPHQWLDGSVSAKERARRIDAFQDGEGDVFVISLKAGGVGVNLTGADYVIHMDPWWNPAVEEQATSRSHRLGQERPVTVYRLVGENTVEERILELHHDKRALAEDLLEGIDKATKLDLDQLKQLLA